MSSELVKAFLSFQGTAILFIWIFIGPFAGLVIFLVASIASLIISWNLRDYSIALEIPLYLSLAGFGFYLRSQIQKENRQANLKIEAIQKNSNIAIEGMASHNGVQEALKKKLHRFFQLKELASDLSPKLDISAAADTVAKAAFKIIGKADSCYFYIVDTKEQRLSLLAAEQRRYRNVVIKNKIGDIFDLWTFKQRCSLFIEDARKDYRFDLDKNTEQTGDTRSLISSPLLSQEKVIGILRLNNRRPAIFVQDDLRLLDIISNIAAVALEKALLYQRTKELAITDSLTGAYVHRFFKERLDEEVVRALRSSSSVSVLLLDIDYFKAYNDRFGHTAGDIVLKKVTDLLNKITQDSGNIVARYGGEEFAVILVNKAKEEAVACASCIKKTVEKEVFKLRRENTTITVSIGIASCPQDAKLGEDLIKSADDALYKAKKSGRNCVVTA